MVKNPPANAGDAGYTGSIPGPGRSPGEGNSNPLQYSCLANPMDRGGWWTTVHTVAKRVGHDLATAQFKFADDDGMYYCLNKSIHHLKTNKKAPIHNILTYSTQSSSLSHYFTNHMTVNKPLISFENRLHETKGKEIQN